MNESADANSSSQLNCLRIRYIPETDVHRNNQRPLFAIVQRARRPHHLNEPRARCVSTGSRLLQPWYLEPDPNRDSHGYQSQGFFFAPYNRELRALLASQQSLDHQKWALFSYFGCGAIGPKRGEFPRGPAFEVMFNIIHKLKQLRLRDRFDLTFFAPMPNPGARPGERAAAAVQAQLRAEGLDLRFGKKILKFDAQGVELEAGVPSRGIEQCLCDW